MIHDTNLTNICVGDGVAYEDLNPKACIKMKVAIIKGIKIKNNKINLFISDKSGNTTKIKGCFGTDRVDWQTRIYKLADQPF